MPSVLGAEGSASPSSNWQPGAAVTISAVLIVDDSGVGQYETYNAYITDIVGGGVFYPTTNTTYNMTVNYYEELYNGYENTITYSGYGSVPASFTVIITAQITSWTAAVIQGPNDLNNLLYGQVISLSPVFANASSGVITQTYSGIQN